MKKEVNKMNLKDIELLSENSNGVLVGGFSIVTGSTGPPKAYSIAKNVGCAVTNNCNGGNCTTGCGGL